MTDKTVSPAVKSALELGPVIAFFAAYLWLKDDSFTIGGQSYDGFIVVTAGFVPLILLSTAILWRLTGTLSRMQVTTAVLITVFGGLSVWLNDDRFIKMKPTAIYLIFAGLLGIGLLRGRSYMQFVMAEMLPLTETGWMILTRRLALFFVALAVLNEVVWRGFSTETWVYFKTFGLTAAMFAFFMGNAGVLTRHAKPEDDAAAD